jgi:hypothetical protein
MIASRLELSEGVDYQHKCPRESILLSFLPVGRSFSFVNS